MVKIQTKSLISGGLAFFKIPLQLSGMIFI